MTRKPPDDRARQALDAMIANGAVFHAHDGVTGRSFTYEVAGAGDRDRCRRILSDLRTDAPAFAAFRAAVLNMAEAQ